MDTEAINEWWCWCGQDQAADGHCEGDPWHMVEDVVRPALAEAFDRILGSPTDWDLWLGEGWDRP